MALYVRECLDFIELIDVKDKAESAGKDQRKGS